MNLLIWISFFFFFFFICKEKHIIHIILKNITDQTRKTGAYGENIPLKELNGSKRTYPRCAGAIFLKITRNKLNKKKGGKNPKK